MAQVRTLIKALEILVPDPDKRSKKFIQADHDILYLPSDPGPEPKDYKGWTWERDGLIADGRAVTGEDGRAELKELSYCHWSDEHECWVLYA